MITFERIEPGIYVYYWIDAVDMQEGKVAFEALRELNNKQPYVAIVDMSKLKRLPMDFASMIKLIKAETAEGLKGYVIYNGSHTIDLFIKPFSVIAPTAYRFASDWESAVVLARELLELRSDL